MEAMIAELRQEIAEMKADIQELKEMLEMHNSYFNSAGYKTAKQKAEERYVQLRRYHGEAVSKVMAAQMLGVTRATVYNMITDGRLCTTAYGKVTIKSIATFLVLKEHPDLI